MSTEKMVLLTEFAQNLEFLKKFDEIKLQQLHRRHTKFDSIPPIQKTRSSRFHELSPRIWQTRMKSKPQYEFVRDIALENLRRIIVKQLSIVYDTHMCEEPLYIAEEIPNRLFSWDRKDFIKRRSLDTVWLDVLKKQTEEECLEIRKFKFDLRELRRYLRIILDVFLSGNVTADKSKKRRMFAHLKESIETITIAERLSEELKQNNTSLSGLSVIYLTMLKGKQMSSKPYNQKLFLEKIMMDSVVTDPITMRFMFKSYEDQSKQIQEKSDNAEEKLNAEIQLYVKKMEHEKYCTKNVLQLFYLEIEQYKERIITLTMQYEEEYENVDNKITYKKLSLDKLKEQRRYMVEQLARFREDLENIRLEEAKRESESLRNAVEAKASKSALKKKKAKTKIRPSK